MDHFQPIAEKMIAEMETLARKLDVSGVILIARMDKDGLSWISQMKAVEIMKVVPENTEGHTYPGYNFIGIAYSKAAEMADTRLNSGSKIRPAYQGEFGYSGGLIHEIEIGYILTVFSGATEELDLKIAQAGLDIYLSCC